MEAADNLIFLFYNGGDPRRKYWQRYRLLFREMCLGFCLILS